MLQSLNGCLITFETVLHFGNVVAFSIIDKIPCFIAKTSVPRSHEHTSILVAELPILADFKAADVMSSCIVGELLMIIVHTTTRPAVIFAPKPVT